MSIPSRVATAKRSMQTSSHGRRSACARRRALPLSVIRVPNGMRTGQAAAPVNGSVLDAIVPLPDMPSPESGAYAVIFMVARMIARAEELDVAQKQSVAAKATSSFTFDLESERG